MQSLSPIANGVLLADSLLSPLVVLVLCVVAGVGTVLLLPGRREASIRKIGGIVVLLAALVFVGLLARRSGSGAGTVYFWIFSAIALAGALRVVTHTRPVYSALYFVLTVMATAGLFILLWAEFMAAALVLIYAGAILITYVFVIMLAASSSSERAVAQLAEYDQMSREPLIASAVGFALMGILLFVIFDKAEGLTAPIAGPAATLAVQGNTQELGAYLFQNQLVNLELAGLILTVAMIGAIVIARRRVVGTQRSGVEQKEAVMTAPATPTDDNPHTIPVYGTDNPRHKAYPQT